MNDWLFDARDLLCRLINTPSINPMGREQSDPDYGEARVAAVLAEWLDESGFAVELRDVEPGRPNVLAVLPSALEASAPLILLDAHTDTVEVGDDHLELLQARVEGVRVRGRGACDVKGPMVSMLLALRELARVGGAPGCRVAFAATMGEEYNLQGARHIVSDHFRPDFAIVAEPTSLEIVRAHKGVVRWTVTSHGVAGHGSNPAAGHNAIYGMARLLRRLERDYRETYAGRSHPLLGEPSINVGTIHGGLQYNIIPDRCEIALERRLLPDESVDGVEAELAAFLAATERATPGDRFTLRREVTLEALETPADHPLIAQLRHALTQAGKHAAVRGALWTANSGVYAAHGVPAIVFGPGDISLAHTTHESIDLREVVDAAQILLHTLRSYTPPA